MLDTDRDRMRFRLVIEHRTHDNDTGRGGGQSEFGVNLTGKGDDTFTDDHSLGGELTTT